MPYNLIYTNINYYILVSILSISSYQIIYLHKSIIFNDILYKAMLYKLYFNVSFHICELESTPKFAVNNELRFSDSDQKAFPVSRDEREIVDPCALVHRGLPR